MLQNKKLVDRFLNVDNNNCHQINVLLIFGTFEDRHYKNYLKNLVHCKRNVNIVKFKAIFKYPVKSY